MSDVNNQYHEELLKNQEIENVNESLNEDNDLSFSHQESESSEKDQENSLNLKEFGVNDDEPDLFNTENQSSPSEELLGSTEDDEEDDLEIPAFLRRQKN